MRGFIDNFVGRALRRRRFSKEEHYGGGDVWVVKCQKLKRRFSKRSFTVGVGVSGWGGGDWQCWGVLQQQQQPPAAAASSQTPGSQTRRSCINPYRSTPPYRHHPTHRRHTRCHRFANFVDFHNFYLTQVNLGSNLWVKMSVTD